jgi:uracil permease
VARLAPPPVVGAVLFSLMAHSVYAALQLLFRSGQGGEARAGLVVGASITVGLVVTFMAPEARQSLPPLLRPILANGFVVGLGLALVMEHLILPRRR